MGRYFFTSDEHYGHGRVIEYENRPFAHVDEMDEALIRNHNEVVGEHDTTVHVGDFSYHDRPRTENIISRLNGSHIFVEGSHDKWMRKDPVSLDIPVIQLWKSKIKTDRGLFYIACCHYAMRSWPMSHQGAWHLFGHHHGKMVWDKSHGPCMDVGVDTNNFYPYSMDEVIDTLRHRGWPKGKKSRHGDDRRQSFGAVLK